MKVYDSQGNAIDVPDLDTPVVQGGGQVAMVGPDGWRGTIPAERVPEALQAGFHPEAPAAHDERRRETLYGDAPVTAGLEGAARGLTLGLSDAALNTLGEGTAQRKERNPLAALLGEGASLLAPVGAPGLVGKAGRVAEGVVAGTDAIRALDAGGAAARLLGGAAKMGTQAATEGVLFGAGAGVSDLALSKDPINAEAIASELGGNMLFGGLTAGAAGVGLSALGSAARAAAVRVRNAAGRFTDRTAEELGVASSAAPAAPTVPPGGRGPDLTGGAPAAGTPMGSPELWSDLSAKHAAGDNQAVRDGLSTALVDTYGIKPGPGEVRFEKLDPTISGKSNWDGSISLQPELQGYVGEALQDLAAGNVATQPAKKQSALSTYVHEILHQVGSTPGAYQGGGAVVEEVATEIAARRVMRDLSARAIPKWPEVYDDALAAVVNAVKARGRVSVDVATKMVEDASLSLKGAGQVVRDPLTHVEDFVSHIPDLKPAAREKLIGDLSAMELDHLPAAKFKVRLAPSLEGEAAEEAQHAAGLDLDGAKDALAAEVEKLRQGQTQVRQQLAADAVKTSKIITETTKDLPSLAERVGTGDPELGKRLLTAARTLDSSIESISRDPERFIEALARVERHLGDAAALLPEQPAPTTMLWQQFIKGKITPYVKKFGGRDAAMAKLSEEYQAMKAGLTKSLPEKTSQISDALGDLETMRNRLEATMVEPASARRQALEERLEELRRPKAIEEIINDKDHAVLKGPTVLAPPDKSTIASEVQDLREAARVMGNYLPGIAARGGADGRGFVREINQAERALGGVAKLPHAILRNPSRALDAIEGYEQTLRQLVKSLPEKDAGPAIALADRAAALQQRLESVTAAPSVGQQIVDAVKDKALDAAGPIAGGIAGSLLGGPIGALTGAVVGAGLGALRKRLGSSTAEFASTITAKLDSAMGKAFGSASKLADDAANLAVRKQGNSDRPTAGDKAKLAVSFGAAAAATGDRDSRHNQVLDVLAASANPDVAQKRIHEGLTGIRAIDPALADQLEAVAMTKLKYLASVAPKDPGIGAPGQDRWTPSDAVLARFARIVAVTEQPLLVLDHLNADTLTPPVIDAVKNTAPEVWKRVQQGVLERLASVGTLSSARKLGLSMLTASPIDSRLTPQYLATQQARFTAMRAEAEQQGKRGSTPPPPRHGTASDADLTAVQAVGAAGR